MKTIELNNDERVLVVVNEDKETAEKRSKRNFISNIIGNIALTATMVSLAVIFGRMSRSTTDSNGYDALDRVENEMDQEEAAGE